MKKLSIHVMTTHKHMQWHQSILDTWLKGVEDYIFYTDYDSGMGNQVELTPNDTYKSNEEKNLKELQRIYDEGLYEKYKWFCFCDDDTVINLKMMRDYLEDADPSRVHGKQLSGMWAPRPDLLYLSGGAGYLISSEIIKEHGHTLSDERPWTGWADVTVGLWYEKQGIESKPVAEPVGNRDVFGSLMMNTPEYYDVADEDICKYMSFHYIRDNKLREKVNSLFNNGEPT